MREIWILVVFALVVVVGRDARALPPDPAARGLDVYLHLSDSAVPGGRVEVLARAYGFPSVTEAAPLAGATIEAGWDPETLDGAAPPPTVLEKTDGDGRARLVVEVPRGKPRALSLLVAVRHGTHARVRSTPVKRGVPARVELHTAETRVVPTSTISAWVRVTGASDEPLPDAGVVVSLLEGGVARHTQALRTDRGGMIMARVPIPRIDEPVWQWTLRARLDGESDRDGVVAPADVALSPREETPGTPSLDAAWNTPSSGAGPGDRLPFELRVRDASGQPVADHAVRFWIGARGTSPPSDEDWEKSSTRATTDGAGRIAGSRDAPTLVAAKGTSLHLVARTVVLGHVLEKTADVAIGGAHVSAEVVPESTSLVPGVTQRMFLKVTDGRGGGIAGEFAVTGDGLSADVTTDARGEAEITWSAPAGVGASRNSGPCAGGVAAAVTVRAKKDLEQLRSHREPFILCVSVDRDAEGLVRVTPDVARPGERVHVVVTRAASAAKATRSSYSAVLRARGRDHASSAWLTAGPDGTASGDVTVPEDAAGGLWALSVAKPDGAREARVLGTDLLVVPTIAPLLTVKRTGGRAAPGGVVELEAQLTDGRGRGLPGAVSAIVVDAFGGGHADVSHLDLRSRLCALVSVDHERCTAVLEREASTEALRRALLGEGKQALLPVNDPGAHASKDLEAAFGVVLRSLEGAVFESTQSPESLLDARRKEGGRWVWNPELFTIVTASMNEPPMTPGGERLTLADLAQVDSQVTFDNVARRVTRLKLFKVLAALRAYRASKNLDPDEPVFKDPNALLRRLVQTQALDAAMLLDPWGGTIQFVRGPNAGAAPFLGVVRGFELRAPGPDGVVGTADDVRDPFERVVRSGSPYARASREDEIVDAKWDMVVSEETVASWERIFGQWTGTQMGDSFGAGGLGLSGVGEGGGGSGNGIGLGSIGTIGHGRGSGGIANGDAYWTAPVRTDADGRVRLSVPLGAAETTWRLAFVGVPDGLATASTTLDVASELPLSVRVDAGARWVEGDVVATKMFVRNRTGSAVRATLEVTAQGSVTLDDKSGSRVVDVPANGGRAVEVRVRAANAGTGTLVVTARGAGLPEDVVRHTWEVAPPGESRSLTRTAWVEGSHELRIELDQGYHVDGRPRLVLERGYDDAVADALGSLEPERQSSAHALLDAHEAAVRVQRWATTKGTPRHRALAEIAGGIARRALGRHVSYAELDRSSAEASSPSAWALRARYAALAKQPGELCPPAFAGEHTSRSAARGDEEEEILDVEPPPSATVPPCWGAYVGSATGSLAVDGDAERLARAVLALAERPHRAALASSLADRLRRVVDLDASGELSGKDVALADRPRRALIYAALLRAHGLGTSKATAATIFGRLAVLRDAHGGYGSSSATLAVVRALLSSQLEGRGVTHVQVRTAGFTRDVDVGESGSAVLVLPPGTLEVDVATTGPGLVARLERPVLRLWSRPPPPQESPVSLDVTWPADARAGSVGMLRLALKSSTEAAREIDVRIPLPPGAALGAPTRGASQVQGVLAVRAPVDRSSVIEIPVRFGLAGTTTAPEATARLARSMTAPATAPARALVIR